MSTDRQRLRTSPPECTTLADLPIRRSCACAAHYTGSGRPPVERMRLCYVRLCYVRLCSDWPMVVLDQRDSSIPDTCSLSLQIAVSDVDPAPWGARAVYGRVGDATPTAPADAEPHAGHRVSPA